MYTRDTLETAEWLERAALPENGEAARLLERMRREGGVSGEKQ